MLPALVISMTAFLRIILVLGFMRNAIGLQQMPPNQVIIGFGLFSLFCHNTRTRRGLSGFGDTLHVREMSEMDAGDSDEPCGISCSRRLGSVTSP